MIWLTSIGLVADIIGFALLAWDLLPEYRLYQLRRQNKQVHDLNASEVGEIAKYAGEDSSDPLGALVIGMRYLQSFDLLRTRVGLPAVGQEDYQQLTLDLLAVWRDEVEQAIDAKERALRGRPRPPITLGIALVLLGFALQLAGSLPSDIIAWLR